MKRIPLYDETKPIACTIEQSEVAARIELIEEMRKHLRTIERTEHGMLLRFPKRSHVEADLHRFSIDEKRCCEFWGFAIDSHGDELIFYWDAPPDASELVDQFVAYFSGDEPLSSISGLL